jgi:hypothetical protein
MKFSRHLIAALCLVAACSSKKEGPILPIQPVLLPNVERPPKKPTPVIQIREVANISAENMKQLVSEYFHARGVQVADGDDPSGMLFETVSYETKGNGCEEEQYSRAPISCWTKFYFKIDPINEVASSLFGRYTQSCDVAHEKQQLCAGSFGEQHLLSLASIIESN